MMYSLAKPLRTLLAVVLLLATVAAIVFFTVVPVIARVGELQEQIEQERTVLGRLTTAAADDGSSTDVKQKAVAARVGGLFLPGESESIRVSYVQSELITILSTNRMKPRSTRNLPARERNQMRLVGVQLQVTAQIEQVQLLLRDIEAHQPPLMIESLHITPVANFGGGGEDMRGMLDARIDIFGVEPQKKGQ